MDKLEKEFFFYKCQELKRLFDTQYTIQEIKNELIEFEKELDEDISPTITYLAEDGFLGVRGSSVEQYVINREEARKKVQDHIDLLKKDCDLLSDSMSLLTKEERDIVSVIFSNTFLQDEIDSLLKSAVENLYEVVTTTRVRLEFFKDRS